MDEDKRPRRPETEAEKYDRAAEAQDDAAGRHRRRGDTDAADEADDRAEWARGRADEERANEPPSH